MKLGATARMSIELKPRLAPAGAWNAGKPLRGDREIWVDGIKWGHVVMVGHGCHGPSYEFYNALGGAIPALNSKGQPSAYNTESVRGPDKRSSWREDVDKTPVADRVVAKARELILADRMEHPNTMLERQRAFAERRAIAAKEEEDRNDLVRAGLLSVWRRTDLSNAERESLAIAFKEIFSAAIEAADLKSKATAT